MAEFKELGCEVLGVSVDSQFSHLAWVQTPRNEGGIGDINYGLVAFLVVTILWVGYAIFAYEPFVG